MDNNHLFLATDHLQLPSRLFLEKKMAMQSNVLDSNMFKYLIIIRIIL